MRCGNLPQNGLLSFLPLERLGLFQSCSLLAVEGFQLFLVSTLNLFFGHHPLLLPTQLTARNKQRWIVFVPPLTLLVVPLAGADKRQR